MSITNRDDGRVCFMDCGRDYCICKTRTYSGDITKLNIKEAADYVFNAKREPKERVVVAYTGCITYGFIEYNKFCNNPECKNCQDRARNLLELMKEEVQKQLKDLDIDEEI